MPPITSGNCTVWPFPLSSCWCRHPHTPHEPLHGNQLHICSVGLMSPAVRVTGGVTTRPACLLHAAWQGSCVHTYVSLTTLVEPGMLFDLEHITTPSRRCPRRMSPITSGHGKVFPFTSNFLLVPSPACAARTIAWKSVAYLLCASDESACPCEGCGDDTARMLTACSFARLLLAYVGFRDHAG